MPLHILERFSHIKLMAFDLDGVLTNGKMLIQSNNEWVREMDIKDGLALQLAVKHGFHVAVISGSFSEPVKNRLSYLGIHQFYEKVTSKSVVLSQLMEEYALTQSQIMYMGDDLPDLDAFSVSGLKTCPADAVEEVKMKADYISVRNGGDGCVRDVIEKVMKTQHAWMKISDTSSL